MINCEKELILTWSQNRALSDMTERAAGNNNDPPAIVAPTFQITDTKLYLPVVSLSTENDKKTSEQLNSGIYRIYWINSNYKVEYIQIKDGHSE